MAVSLKKSEVIIKQCEALSQLVAKFNKDVENMIAITTNDMNYLLSSIQENIKETTSIVMNDLNEWEEIKKNLSTTIIQGKVVLNVGGREFLTTVETLTKEKNSFFTGLFSESWNLEKDNRERIFIDRNGDLFAEVLDFMRNPHEFILPDERLRKRLINEAKFYKLKSFLEVLTEPERKLEEEKRKRQEEIFIGDTLLTIEQKQKLNEFYGKNDQLWKLIYKATRDGFEGTTFHKHSDNQGPTMVIIQSTGGFLFGGYASESWKSIGNYINAQNSFLFLLTNANGNQPTKFLYNNNGHALYDNNSYGPTYGNGHDLYIYVTGAIHVLIVIAI
ncbi:unnamed protein product [Rotaria sp. Silwood2]|nr:unnamed protein product [Rotaria sp. Silwood2]CAF3241594.1 unnamed protein product [Rotaria sp. Silwood2]CAF3328986.1 unnamed protein product [Rotaria sp. Silwood2]CAF4129225.1 unnamed protein product [Rotaria sp. Silwood2]CAF4158413.1 unnamed protein product [Rotaria sp. Silwood2]